MQLCSVVLHKETKQGDNSTMCSLCSCSILLTIVYRPSSYSASLSKFSTSLLALSTRQYCWFSTCLLYTVVNEPVILVMRLSLPEATNKVCVLIVWCIMSILGNLLDTCRADHPNLKMSSKMILLQE